jgi:hypothetical protein
MRKSFVLPDILRFPYEERLDKAIGQHGFEDPHCHRKNRLAGFSVARPMVLLFWSKLDAGTLIQVNRAVPKSR